MEEAELHEADVRVDVDVPLKEDHKAEAEDVGPEHRPLRLLPLHLRELKDRGDLPRGVCHPRSRTRRLSAAWREAGRAAAPAGQAQDGEGLPLLQAAR